MNLVKLSSILSDIGFQSSCPESNVVRVKKSDGNLTSGFEVEFSENDLRDDRDGVEEFWADKIAKQFPTAGPVTN